MSRGRGRRGGARGGARGGGARRGGRGGRRQTNPTDTDPTSAQPKADIDVETQPKEFFIGNASFDDHLKGQNTNKVKYAAALAALLQNGVTIAQNARIRALAAAWARGDFELSRAFLQNREHFGLVEVLKALTLLDSGRQIRVLEKKTKRLELSTNQVNRTTMGRLKRDIDNLQALKPSVGSASGAVCKHISEWVRTLTEEELQFYALHLPKGPWRKLADICHFNPKKDFPALPWFLPFCFGEPAPEGTIVNQCRDVTADNVNDLVTEFDVPYSHVKTYKSKLTSQSKARIAHYEPKLDTVLWWYEDLACPEVDKIIQDRIVSGEEVNLPNGKLLERLLTFKIIRENISVGWSGVPTRNQSGNKACFLSNLIPIGEKKLTSIRLSLEAPIVVIGDASGSMQVAIRTSTIIASLLTAITSARLVFFNTQNREAPYLPETIEQVLDLAISTSANGGTTPAASLWPFYENKEEIKTFIIVTDEEENGKCHNLDFCDLYKKYHDEIYPARLVFVSFLRGQHTKGLMVTKLRAAGFEPLQFTLNGQRPDLTKLDNLFGQLSMDSKNFKDELTVLQDNITSQGLQAVFKSIQNIN